MAQIVQKEDALDLIQLFKSRLDQSGGGGLLPRVIVYSQSGNTVTMSKDGVTLTAAESNGTWSFNIPDYGNWTVTATKNDTTKTFTVNVDAVKIYESICYTPVRYGIRINKTEPDPDNRVEYLYDAVGMTPAHMVYDTDTTAAGTDSDTSYFDYGDWADVWFVRDNKPCMLKSNGTVDYYLDPNDYDKKVDGSTSDVGNTSYDGNAMVQFPLVWIYRYEDDDYLYEIISDIQWDSNY
ncbi:MAG: hypothetical protein IJU91_04915, partial [Selenomonadaceae bacterium]|nr:hypothetical protein [Selenomonadaceae bacterium]